MCITLLNGNYRDYLFHGGAGFLYQTTQGEEMQSQNTWLFYTSWASLSSTLCNTILYSHKPFVTSTLWLSLWSLWCSSPILTLTASCLHQHVVDISGKGICSLLVSWARLIFAKRGEGSDKQCVQAMSHWKTSKWWGFKWYTRIKCAHVVCNKTARLVDATI